MSRLKGFTMQASSIPALQYPWDGPTSAKDAVGLVLNAYLKTKLLVPDPNLATVTPGDLARGELQLTSGAKFTRPIPVRARI